MTTSQANLPSSEEISALLTTLPLQIRQALAARDDLSELTSVRLNLGVPPEARFGDREEILDPKQTTQQDLDFVIRRIHLFRGEREAGAARSLRCISTKKNAAGKVVGLILRVGRAVFGEELSALIDVLPPQIREHLTNRDDLGDLLEVVLDLGRKCKAYFPNREAVIGPHEISQQDIDYVTERINPFNHENRAGVSRTLHRISAIKNDQCKVVGLSCRINQAVYGTAKIIEDLVRSGHNILLLGKPGVGRTTMLRESARLLSVEAQKRVVIIDTHNEIGGDGDIPHPAIGHARKLRVTPPNQQYTVMIEAVENHIPEVLIIDDLHTELEATTARLVAERGIQVLGTVHGQALVDLVKNPEMSDLIGGIQDLTLPNEESKPRASRKPAQDRKAPPTFDVVVEIQDRNRVAVHNDAAQALDRILQGKPATPEVRYLENGEVRIEGVATSASLHKK